MCPKSDEVRVVTMETSALLTAVRPAAPKEHLATLREFLNSPKARSYLRDYEWTRHESRSQMLSNVLSRLRADKSLSATVAAAIAAVLPHVGESGAASKAPMMLRYACVAGSDASEAEAAAATTPPVFLGDAFCDPGVVEVTVVDVSSLFQALTDGASRRDRFLVTNVFGHVDFAAKLHNFYFDNYKTKGDLLRYLLSVAADDQTSAPEKREAAKRLLENVAYDGAAEDNLEYTRACSVSLEEKCHLVHSPIDVSRSSVYATDVTAPADLSMTPPSHDHGYIVQPVKGHCPDDPSPNASPVVKVSVDSLFGAFDESTSEADKYTLLEFFDHPQFSSYIQGFIIKPYKMKGALLKDLLWYLVAETKKPALPKEILQVIMNVRDHVRLTDSGGLAVEKVMMCNTTGKTFEDLAVPIDEAFAPCVGTETPKSSKLDVLTLLTSLDNKVPLKSLTVLMEYFMDRQVENSLKYFKITANETRGALLDALLSTLANETHVDNQTKETLLNLRSHIQKDGPGSIVNIPNSCSKPLKYPEDGSGPILMQNNGNICANSTDPFGYGFKLHVPSFISVLHESAPRPAVTKMVAFLLHSRINTMLRGFDVSEYTKRGPFFRDMMHFFSGKPYIERNVRRAASSVVPYVRLTGVGRLPLIIITTCNDIDAETVPPPTNTPELGICSHRPYGEPASLVDMESLIRVFEPETPIGFKARLFGFLSQNDVHSAISTLDEDSYITKGELVQDIIVEIWMNSTFKPELRDAAKKLLPYVSFEGTGGLPPKRKEVCINPANKEILLPPFPTPMPWKFEFVSDKPCPYIGLDIPATKVYSFDIDSVLQAFQPNTNPIHIATFKDYLMTAGASSHLLGLDLDKATTRGELLQNMVTLMKFSKLSGGNVRAPVELRDALKYLSPRVRLKDATARTSVAVASLCRPQSSKEHGNKVLNQLIALLPEDDRTPQLIQALNDIFVALTKIKGNIGDVLPSVDPDRAPTRYELLRQTLLKLRENSKLKVDKEIALVLMHIVEKTSDTDVPKLGDAESKTNNTIVDIDYLELLKVFKKDAPKDALQDLEKFMKAPEFKDVLRDFNASSYIRQGELLVAVLEYLSKLDHVSKDLKIAISILIPFIDFDDLGSLPPTIHRVHVKTRTQVSIITLDFGSLFRSIPRKKLSAQGKVALDNIFKYLSRPSVDFRELFRGISPQQSSRIQLKILLLKIHQTAGDEVAGYAAILLDYLSKELPDSSAKSAVPLPNLDWIEVLHAVPEINVPPEVIYAKKDIYAFFISSAFKNIAQNYIADVSDTRAKLLRDLLFFMRNRPELKIVRTSIAYLMPFIKEKGLGDVVVSEDIIRPREEEEGKMGEYRVRELLYQAAGMTKHPESQNNVKNLQNIFTEFKIQLGSTFIGWQVLDDFPQKEKLIIILNRIRRNYGIFLSTETLSAIDTLLEELGQKPEDEDQTNNELSKYIDELFENTLQDDTPAEIKDAAKTVFSFFKDNKHLLRRVFEGITQSMKRLDKKTQMSVVLRAIWQVVNKEIGSSISPFKLNSEMTNLTESLKLFYKYLNPQKQGIDVGSQEHYTTITTTLDSLIPSDADADVIAAKKIIEEHMDKNEHIYDASLAKLVSLGLSPKELVARALRRYRESQPEMSPKLWTAVSKIFNYLKVEEHDSTEDETDSNFSLVDEFKDIVDETGQGAGRSRQIVLKFMMDHKYDIEKIYKGHRMLFKYPPKEKMALIFGRLLRLYRSKLNPSLVTAIGDILRRVEFTGESAEEVFADDIDVMDLLEEVLDKSAPENVKRAKKLIENMFHKHPNITEDVVGGVVIQENFPAPRRLAVILRRLQKKYRLKMSDEEKEALNTIFRFLEVSEDNSVEDQFAGGNFNFNSLFLKVFPNDTEHEIMEASERVQDLLVEADLRRLLKGLALWTLPEETQVGLILYRMYKKMNLSKADNATVISLIENLNYEIGELESEDRDESYKPGVLFDEAFGKNKGPPEVQEATGILLHHILSGRSTLSSIYRGIDFDQISTPKERLMALLRNVYYKRDILGKKVAKSLQIVSDYFKESLSDGEIDPFTFNFTRTFDAAIPSFAPTVVQHAKHALQSALRKRPGTFKRVLQGVRVSAPPGKGLAGESGDETSTAAAILRAVAASRRLTPRVRTAADVLLRFLRGAPLEETDPGIRELLQDAAEAPEGDEVEERMMPDLDGDDSGSSKRRAQKPRRRSGRRRDD